MNEHSLSIALATAQRVSGVTLPFEVTMTQGEKLTVEWAQADGVANITAPDVNALTRGIFLLCCAVKEGKDSLSLTQERRIASLGAMVDCSRNAVPTLETVKRSLDRHACLGMNLFMLYTEDTYEVPEYPRLGYLRGRFSQKDLRELDDYADALGIELVPCIQTLGHMGQFLQWPENDSLCDQRDILLIDHEETYTFIEACIRSLRACFRSHRIHIGMDEAHGVGLGNYLRKYGQTERFALLSRHLGRVIDLCTKYDFKPMMWSDMYFRLGSKNNEYYDDDISVPQEVIDHIPPVSMVYWDYYHTDEATYNRMLTEHERMTKDVVFAGGIWVWSGFLPAVKRTEATMLPGLRAAAKHHVGTVLATMWGDDGAETNYTLAEGLLPIFSESCWQGENVAHEEMIRLGEHLTGEKRAYLDAMGDFYRAELDQRAGKAAIWADPLYHLAEPMGESYEEMLARFDGAMHLLADSDQLSHQYAAACFDVAMQKTMLLRDLYPAYTDKDMEYLSALVEEILPVMIESYRTLRTLHKRLWHEEMRPFGWEVISARYDGAIGRLEDLQELVEDYLMKRIDTIAELDDAPLPGQRYEVYMNLYTSMRPFL